jgi:hypothetical protein
LHPGHGFATSSERFGAHVGRTAAMPASHVGHVPPDLAGRLSREAGARSRGKYVECPALSASRVHVSFSPEYRCLTLFLSAPPREFRPMIGIVVRAEGGGDAWRWGRWKAWRTVTSGNQEQRLVAANLPRIHPQPWLPF